VHGIGGCAWHTKSNGDDDVISLSRSEWRDWTGAEEALSGLARAAGAARRKAAGAAAAGDRGDRQSDSPAPSPGKMASRRRRPMRVLGRYGAAVCLGVLATLAWQSHGDTAKHLAASAIASAWEAHGKPATQTTTQWFAGLWQSHGEPAKSKMAGWFPKVWIKSSSGPTPQAPADDQAAAPLGAEHAKPRDSADHQNWEALAGELAGLRKAVEEIAANQDQMGRDVARLQLFEQSIRLMIPGLPQAGATQPRKPTSPAPRG
jgi:hypothetical protein